jgi:acetylornithine deacetylase/succinyl-diaminopimelate desuccinylase-like protein
MPSPQSSTDLDARATREFVAAEFAATIVPALERYIAIPAKSPHFDADWAARGEIDRAVALAEAWCRAQGDLEDATIEVVRLPGRTPVLCIEVPGRGARAAESVLLYGHLDKQPEMVGWRAGLDPWRPVREGDRLYGRGGADDGYAVFASLTAIRAVRRAGLEHARCFCLIETCEESGSYDLPAYLEALAERIGEPSLVICLDSGAGDYRRLWSTTSLRGLLTGTLRVEVLSEGVHSGDAGGIVPDSFRVARALLSRLEDPLTGRILLPELHAAVPAERLRQARAVAAALGAEVDGRFPLPEGAAPRGGQPLDLVLARTWEPALAVTGAGGLPPIADAGNVLRPVTELQLSLRLPPTVDAERAAELVERCLLADPPPGTVVRFRRGQAASGWDAPALAPWLERAATRSSERFFGAPAAFTGEGWSIPFMGLLGRRFPRTQFLIAGVLGPGSNAHGPNEFLHLPMAEGLTCCVAQVLVEHGRRSG